MVFNEEKKDADKPDAADGSGIVDREVYRKDFETLELGINASPDDATDAYRQLKEAYSPDMVSMSSPVGYAIEKKRRQDMIDQIESAYRSLQRLFEKETPAPSVETAAQEADASPPEAAVQEEEAEETEAIGEAPGEAETPIPETAGETAPEAAADPDAAQEDAPPDDGGESEDRPMADIADFSGQTLKEIREKLNVSLERIYEETKIRIPTLENLETENFPDLPPEVYVKGFVKSYAACLSLDPIATARIYMEKYHEWQRRKGGKKHRQQHHAPFRLSKKKDKKGAPAL